MATEQPTSRRSIDSGSRFESEIGYSRAVVDGDWVLVSGTTGFDYRTMQIADDVVEQAEQSLRNIDAALHAAGATIDDVLRVRYIVPDAADFPRCWPVLRRWFGTVRPAATMIAAGLADPRMRIEIEVTARRRDAGRAGAAVPSTADRAPAMIFDHVGLPVADRRRSEAFFGAALAPLGIGRLTEAGNWVGFGRDGRPQFWFGESEPLRQPVHIAFAAADRATVRAFHAAAIAAGGRDNGRPGLRPHYHPNYYGAFVLCPDGHNIEAVCHAAEAA